MKVDKEAGFREFVATRQTALVRTGRLLTGDWSSGEDLVQAALVKTYLAWPKIKDKDAVEAYVRKTMARLAVSWSRKRSSTEQPTAEPPDRPVSYPDPVADDDPLWRAVRTLPPGQRAVLVLRFHADLSEADTAAALGVTVGTVKSQAARALTTLRGKLTVPEVTR
ncbi:SigE family RNA polymerase sigma factor [Actinokineospora soli]|uniref:SigE family RNA polymerase sigma factor n=1 Tax=Actinokineospora soli TaxID=1048753 RepID=A0ABW2TP68_9PSEU